MRRAWSPRRRSTTGSSSGRRRLFRCRLSWLRGADWLFVEHLPGMPLSTVDNVPARRDLGAAIALLHGVTGPRFGYTGARPSGIAWPEAFTAIVESLLADAVAWGVTLPVPPSRIRSAVDRGRDVLGLVDRPALLHFDLWDGNVLAVPGGLSGLVDGERYLYGDPLMDFVSPSLFGRIEDEPQHPFLSGYGDVVLDDAARHRIALYRLHLYLYLLMVVEMPSRGMTLESDGWRLGLLVDAVNRASAL